MKKIGLLNQDLSGVIAGMGHMDVLVVADACFVARLSGARPNRPAGHRAKTCGFGWWYSQQICAGFLAPVNFSSTNRALNPALNLRRLSIAFALSWTDCT